MRGEASLSQSRMLSRRRPSYVRQALGLLLLVALGLHNAARFGISPPVSLADLSRSQPQSVVPGAVRAVLAAHTPSPTPAVPSLSPVASPNATDSPSRSTSAPSQPTAAPRPPRAVQLEPRVTVLFPRRAVLPSVGSLVLPAKWEKCAVDDFGAGLLTRWRNAAETYCHRTNHTAFRCHDIHQNRIAAHENSNFCTMDEAVFQNGLVYVDCDVSTKNLRVWHALGAVATWRERIRFDPAPAPPALQFRDSASVTMFVHRDCRAPFNPFHCFTDLVCAYYMIEMYNLAFADTRIVFLDDQPQGTFWELWKALSPNLYPREEWSAWTQGVAVSRGIFVPISQTALLWKDFWKPTHCDAPAPLLVGLRRRFLEHVYANVQLPVERFPCDKAYRITFPARINNHNRHISNRGELLGAMRREFGNACIVEVDFATLAFAEQAALLRETDLMLGMHGAAFQMMMFLKPTAHLLEMHPQNSWARCFENQAKWMNISYHFWLESTPMPSPQQSRVDVAQVMAILRDILPAAAKTVAPPPVRAR